MKGPPKPRNVQRQERQRKEPARRPMSYRYICATDEFVFSASALSLLIESVAEAARKKEREKKEQNEVSSLP